MNKAEVKEKLINLTREIKEAYLEYMDSLEEEGNEIGKEEGYLSIAIFRDSMLIDSSHDELELKEENQIRWFHQDK